MSWKSATAILKVKVPEGVSNVLGEGYLDGLDGFDLLVRTAGLPPQDILGKNPGAADKDNFADE